MTELLRELDAQSKFLRKAAAEIAAAGHAGWGNTCLQAAEALDTHHAEIAEALKDARRYRWLRANCKREWESDMPHNKGAPSLDIDFSADGHDLDAAIDDAMHNSAREVGE